MVELWRERTESRRRAAERPAKPPPAMTTWKATSAARLASLGAGPLPGHIQRRAHGLRQPPADSPGGAAEGVVGHSGEAFLVGSQRQQEMRDPIRWRQLGLGHPHAEAVHALRPGAHEQR